MIPSIRYNRTITAGQKRIMDCRGFTIVEILLAFFIFSILAATIYASYTGSFNTISLTESRMEVYRKAAITLDRISEDLSAAYISLHPAESFGQPAGYTRFLGEDSDLNGNEADSLSFFSRISPLFEDGRGITTGQLISYDVVEGDGEGELVLLRSENPEFGDENEDRPGLKLSDGLHSVAFNYVDDEGQSHESWDSDSEEFGGLLPRTVSVTLEFQNRENPDAPFRFMTGVTLPVLFPPEIKEEPQ